MTDTEILDFLESTEADTGQQAGQHYCLVWGWYGGVRCMVASGRSVSLRESVRLAAEVYARELLQRTSGKGQAA